jgi:hypothetical protein
MVSGIIEPPEAPAVIVSHDKRGSTLGDAISENHAHNVARATTINESL